MGVKLVTKEIVNRKAKFEYHFIQMYEAGIVLTGTEVKALRLGLANLNDAYCLVENGNLTIKSLLFQNTIMELYIITMHAETEGFY